MKLVPKIFLLLTLATSIFINSAPAFSQAFVPPPDRRSGDSLTKVYSELKVGMTLSEVRNLAEKYYPDCHLKDTDVWAGSTESGPRFSWVLGIDGKPIRTNNEELAQLHRIVLRMDFDNNMKLMNAVYVRINNKDFKNMKKGAQKFALGTEERKALVGDGYYK